MYCFFLAVHHTLYTPLHSSTKASSSSITKFIYMHKISSAEDPALAMAAASMAVHTAGKGTVIPPVSKYGDSIVVIVVVVVVVVVYSSSSSCCCYSIVVVVVVTVSSASLWGVSLGIFATGESMPS